MSKASGKPGPDPGTAGRPTKYKDEYSEQAYKLCLLGFTNEQLAQFFEVSIQTIDNWKNEYCDFFDAIKKGKEIADANTAVSLYKRANGYTHPETKLFTSRDEEGKLKIVEHTVIKYYPPDTGALAFWLKNRQPGIWREIKHVEAKHDITTMDIQLTSEEEAAYKKRMESFLGGAIEEDIDMNE